MAIAKSHRELRVYQLAFESATQIHEVTKNFPSEEKIRPYRPDQEVVTIRLREHCGGVAQAKILKEFCEQIDRFRFRSD